MNAFQTLFSLFYSLFWAMTISITGKTHPFDTPSMSKGYPRAWLRFFVSILDLNLSPLACFVLVYKNLNSTSAEPLTFWSALCLFLPSLVGLGFYRLHYGLMLLKGKKGHFFYDRYLYGRTKGLPASIYDDLKTRPEHHSEPMTHIIPGLLWILLSMLPALRFILDK